MALEQNPNRKFRDDSMPRPNRSSTNRDYTSLVIENNEKDYEQVLTD